MIKQEIEDKLEAVKRISREYSAEVIKSMVEISLNNKYPPSTRVQAAQIVLDRAFGKPKEDSSERDNTKGSFISILRGIKKPEPKIPIIESETLDMFELKNEA